MEGGSGEEEGGGSRKRLGSDLSVGSASGGKSTRRQQQQVKGRVDEFPYPTPMGHHVLGHPIERMISHVVDEVPLPLRGCDVFLNLVNDLSPRGM